MSALKLFLFGPPRVELDGTPVELQRRKAIALLIYLALNGQPHTRDALATLLWPDHDQRRARAYLRRDLAALNTSLAGDWLLADRETIELKSSPDFWSDVTHFRHLLAACQTHNHPPEVICPACLPLLTEAVALYTDDFLAGFTLRDCLEFDDWQFFQMESLRQELASALERLVSGHSAQGAYEAAIPYARRWVGLDPLHEPAQRQLMQLYNQSDQLAAALRQYAEYVDLLEKELGLPPEEETTTLYEAIKAKRILGSFIKAKAQEKQQGSKGTREQGRNHAKLFTPAPPHPHTPAQVSPPLSKSPGAKRIGHNLPTQPTPFIGREKELTELRRLLVEEPACRLLTLVGPGGIGKTRLALEAASQALDAFPDGVYFVALASIAEAEFIVSTIAETLNLPGASAPKAQLLDFLRQKRLLLVIDSFEHLLEGVDLLLEILSTAPQVMLLVTSQERLNLHEEWSYEMQGLRIPQREDYAPDKDIQSLETYGAVRLFLQRARQVDSSFTLLAEDVPALVRICQLVDGMPLGLELAAAWVRLMTCQEIEQEIKRSLDFLTTSVRNVPERHRSLRAVLEQTWQRLSAAEQAVLSKLSAFQGSCHHQAAQAVAGASLMLLSSLVDKALLRRTGDGRYEMHEPIRQFALEQLQTHPDDHKQAQDQHAEYYTDFLQQRADDLKGSRQKAALAEIVAEIDNVRAAWQWAIAHQDAPALEKSIECLWIYSEYRGALHEGEVAFEQAVAAFTPDTGKHTDGAVPEEQASLLGFLLAGQGYLCARLGKLEKGRALMEEGISQLRQARPRDKQKEAFSLMGLGSVLITQGKNEEAKQFGEESLALFSEIGDRWGKTRCLRLLSNAAQWGGQLEKAEQLWQEALAAGREIGDDRIGYALQNLGIIAIAHGAYQQAQQYLDEGVALSRESGDLLSVADGLRERGRLAIVQGEYTQAAQIIQESLTIYKQIGRSNLGAALGYLGMALHLQGQYEEAESLYRKGLAASQAAGHRPEIAGCLRALGRLAHDRGDYQQAEQLLQESLAIWQQVENEPELALVLCNLGHVLTASVEDPRSEVEDSGSEGRKSDGADRAETRQFYEQALKLALKHRLAPVALDVFTGVAGLLVQGQKTHKAVELLSLVKDHPASTHETKEKARQLLTAGLPASTIAVIKAPGQILNWQTTANQIIEELSIPDWGKGSVVTDNPPADSTPFVGRKNEYERLIKAIAQTHSGHGQIILIEGEPGIGKSRLAQEAIRYAQAQGGNTLWQKCYHSEQALPYQVLIDLVAQMLASWPAATFRPVPPSTLAELALLAPEIATIFPNLPSLPGELVEARQARLFRALHQFVVAPAAEGTLMLVLDDIQWADQATLQFLHHLARHISTQAVLLVCTYRTEEVATDAQLATSIQDLQREPHVFHMLLTRLSLQDANLLLEKLRAGSHSAALGQWLYRETEGNPFFLMSILQSLREQGVLTAEADAGWHIDLQALQRADTRLRLPDALRQSVQDRLRRVPQRARHILDVAAVYGRRFEFTTLQAISGERSVRLLDVVEELMARQLLREEEEGHTYDFSHDKIQEVVYHDLSRMRRVLLHRQVAEAIEASDADRVGILAEHFEKGEVWDKAITYLAQSAGGARQLFAMEEALHFWDRAITLAKQHPKAISQPMLLDLYEQRGETRGLVGGHVTEAVADLRLVLNAVQEAGDQDKERLVLTRIGQVYRYGDRYSDALDYLKAALEVARRGGDESFVADALYHLGTTVWSQGHNDQALAYHQEAVDICQRLELTDLVAVQAFHGLGEAYFLAGRAEEAIVLYEKSLELARQIQDKGYESENLGNMGMAMQVYGIADYDRAKTVMARALEISQSAHLEWHSTQILGPLGLAHGLSGNYQQALEYLNKSLRIAESIEAKRFHSLLLDMYGTIWQELNLPDRAKIAHKQAVALAEQADAGWWMPRLQANLAIDRLRLGDLDVEKILQSTFEKATSRRLEIHAVRCLEGLAELALAQDNPHQALHYAEQLQHLAEPGGMREIVAQAQRWRGEALLALGELKMAAAELEQSLAMGAAIGRPRLAWDLHAALAKVYRAQKKEEVALQHEAQVKRIVDNLANNLQDPAIQNALRAVIESEFDGEIHQADWECNKALDVGTVEVEDPRSEGRRSDRAENVNEEGHAEHKPDMLSAPMSQRYVQEALIASGGMGEVYQGRDTETGQRIAIKRLKPDLIDHNPEAVKRLIREGEILRHLNHPNIVKILTTVEGEGQPLIIMEYVPGGSLRDLLEKQPQLPLDRVLTISLELADALARAHHLGIIHRDLKPANVLLAEDGTPRLTDFGVAYLAQQETRLTQEGAILGTSVYMSPEAWRGEALDARSDIWSFGALLYEMLAGRPPFAAQQIAAVVTAILNDPVPELAQFRPNVPPVLAELIKHMLTKERELRIDSMRQVAAGLEVIRREGTAYS